MQRVRSVDALRGLVMIIMALDHVRDFTSAVASKFQPDDLARTTTALFFTRWITHFCAPVFMFTAGMGAFFLLRRGRTKAQLFRFLSSRGLWLIVLELVAIRASISLFTGPILLEVLWALGCSMIVLSVLAFLPTAALAALSAAIICLHNLTDPVRDGSLWTVLHRQGIIQAGPFAFLIAYPLMPWFAVMSAGFCAGAIMTLDELSRRRWLIRIGLALTAAFLILRSLNIYGDPQPFAGTVLSFLRVTKYPPSLDFILMTMGPSLLLLAWFDRLTFSDRNPLIVFGRVPLFYFVLHLFLIRLLAFAIGGSIYGLPVVYLVWIVVVLIMYFPSRWFMKLKSRRRDWWLSYL